MWGPEQLAAAQAALHREYRAAQAADPLGVDGLLPAELPRLGGAGDRDGLLRLLATLLQRAPDPERLAPPEAWAAIRDLGFVMGAVRRAGLEPAGELPALHAALPGLARRADCLHPRDDVYTLTVANPTGERMRTYSGSPSERAFIAAVGGGIVAMDRCLVELWPLLALPLDSPAFVPAAERAQAAFKEVTRELLGVRSRVDPRWFALEFVRHLEPLEIDGARRHGPSADQSPMLVVDLVLHGAAKRDFRRLFDGLAHHLRPWHRELVGAFLAGGGEPIVEQIRRRCAGGRGPGGEAAARSIRAVMALLQAIRSFRYPHRKMAVDSFALRRAEHQIGSGGMTPDRDLGGFIEWTEEAIAACAGALDPHPPAARPA